MQTTEVSKYQFLITITPCERLIVEGYSKMFNMTMQQSALIMCVHGWNSYAKKMTEYSRNCKLQAKSPHAKQLLKIDSALKYHSDEAIAFRAAMKKVSDSILETKDGNPDSMAD